MRSQERISFPTAPEDLGETSNPVIDFVVAVLGLAILALCWAAVWVLVSRPVEGEASGLVASVVQVLESSAQQAVHRGVGPMP